jgi:hypothetical protein
LITEGSYFKIRAVFDSSIKGIFDNCDLVQDREIHVLTAAQQTRLD